MNINLKDISKFLSEGSKMLDFAPFFNPKDRKALIYGKVGELVNNLQPPVWMKYASSATNVILILITAMVITAITLKLTRPKDDETADKTYDTIQMLLLYFLVIILLTAIMGAVVSLSSGLDLAKLILS